MRFLTEPEIQDLARTADWPGWFGTAGDDWAQVEFNTDPLERRPAHGARWLADLVEAGQDVLLWITESGIWPSSDNWHLFNTVRGAYGEARPLREVPGHLFGTGEGDDLVSFLQLALTAGWGGWVLGLGNGHALFFSHDSWAMLRTRLDTLALAGRLDGMGLAFRVLDGTAA